LRKELDDLAGDAADDLDLGEVLLHPRRALALHIVEVHHLVLDVEVELPPQEAAQVLVDEVVEGVARGVAVEMHAQARRLRSGAVGAHVLRSHGLHPIGQ